MKINTDNIILFNSTKVLKRKDKSHNNIFDSLIEAESENKVENTTSASSLSALLTLQEFSEEEQEVIERGQQILRELKQLHLALVCGQVSSYNMQLLQELLISARTKCKDKQLLALLEEIELRAQIELLKLAKNYK